MSELLIEIYSEEIPARMQLKAMEDFKKLFVDFFLKQNISIKEENLKVFIAPRRLVLLVENLSEQQNKPAVNKIGPKTDASSKAIEGFLKSIGLRNVADLEKIDRDDGSYYLYKQPEIKIKTAEILANNLPIILQKMAGTWQKSMNLISIEGQYSWVRPIRNILAIFAGKLLDFEFANLRANNNTFGNLIAGKKKIEVLDFAGYKQELEENFVILDWFKRREIIVNEISKIDHKLVDNNAKLIDEIAGLVEYPKVLIGSVDDIFAKLPLKVLELTIKIHQRSILFNDKSGLKFIFISGLETDEIATKRIIADNEKVVRARLSDAVFYIEEDKKIPFANRTLLLKDVIFHQKLGSIANKIERLKTLNKLIAIWVAKANLSKLEHLAKLSKNDLTTKTVAEMPELQGIIGGYCARSAGEDLEICQAIEEQYLPIGYDGQLPQSPLGIVLAIADKIDTICSLFLADEKPTSSKDPMALRRAALGIIKIAIEKQIALPLKIIIEKAINAHLVRNIKAIYPKKTNVEIKRIRSDCAFLVKSFFIERNKFYLKEKFNLKAEIINDVFEQFANKNNNKDYCPLHASNKALIINSFFTNPDNLAIIGLYKRVVNILAIEEARDGKIYNTKPSIVYLKTKYEKLLYKKSKIFTPLVKKDTKNHNYQNALTILMELEFPIRSFLDNVIINCDSRELRNNRLLILGRIRSLFTTVFNFEKII